MKSSPTVRLLLGLLITLAAVTGFSSYTLYQLTRLEALQNETIDLNRHDSLLLLRIQNDVNTIGLKLRDMTQVSHPGGIYTYRDQFGLLKQDLNSALQSETKLSRARPESSRRRALLDSLKQFWLTSDQVFSEAGQGHEAAARALVRTQLSDQQTYLANSVSRLLQKNTENEASADATVASIYRGVERDVYAFLAATILTIAVTSLYLIYSNRRIFEKMESLSKQRRVLAAKLITVQEEVLRSVSRELHDEFGQILTAVGTMLARAERKGLPPGSPLRTELSEIREITQGTLEKIRSLSQMLHPAVIDDYGLAKAVEWYAEVFQRQTGIQTTASISGTPLRITGQPAIHCFRIVQEALNNAAKHSGTKRAEIQMIFGPADVRVSIKDFGRGMPPHKVRGEGLGLIAMRERAELVGGKLDIASSPEGGTTVMVWMPIRYEQPEPGEIEDEEVLLRN